MKLKYTEANSWSCGRERKDFVIVILYRCHIVILYRICEKVNRLDDKLIKLYMKFLDVQQPF